MASFAAMTVNNNAAVGIVFNPATHSASSYMWRENGVTILAANVISLQMLPSKDKSLARYRLKIISPALEVVTGANAQGYTAAPKLAYNVTSSSDFGMPNRASSTQKLDVIAFNKNVLSQAQVTDLLVNGLAPV